MQGQAPEDPLDNEEQLQEQLESLPYLCRFKSDTMSVYLCQSFDQALQRYSALGQGATPNSTIEMEVRACFCYHELFTGNQGAACNTIVSFVDNGTVCDDEPWLCTLSGLCLVLFTL